MKTLQPTKTSKSISSFELKPNRLYNRCNLSSLAFKDTSELEPFTEVLGQDRAMNAVRFGVGIDGPGFNIYMLGPPGIGKHSLLRTILEKESRRGSLPPDFCYVNNFAHSGSPTMISLPAGQGKVLRAAMRQLVEDLFSSLPSAFESEAFRARYTEIEEKFKERHEKALDELKQEAETQGFTLVRTPMGYAFAPMIDGKIMPAGRISNLSSKEQEDLQEKISTLQQRSESIFRLVPKWRRETQKELKELDRETAHFVVGHLIEELKESYSHEADVLHYLDEVQNDIVEHVPLFLSDGKENPILGGDSESTRLDTFRRYDVNLLVDHSEDQGSPVVYEDNPTFQNLVGQIEHRSQMGNLVTDFSLIKAGALHRANGGYLILDVHKVLMLPFAWEGLKRALKAGEIRVDSLGRMFGAISTVSLEPQPIPLNVKVCLVGDPMLYYLLCLHDPEFPELFKVAADFEDRIGRGRKNMILYARLLADLAVKAKLRPLNKAAVARTIEHASRLADDATKLSVLMGTIVDLLREADFWAQKSGEETITGSHIQKAIDEKYYRGSRIHTYMQEAIERDIIMIDTSGSRIAQINALAVIMLGGMTFGQPHRITATARLGDGHFIDIEREAKLGGATHSKGVLILSSFLAQQFAADTPLALTASLVFEQSYGRIDGDSASLAELCVLLSAIGQVPIKQSLALTGSVNQQGQVQPIGGVNEKVEGFFDVCEKRGLTGDQGVLIPAANAEHLMLRRDIVKACEKGLFHIYTVKSVNEALFLLTGKEAGVKNKQGLYPKGTVNHLVAQRLNQFSETRKHLAEHASKDRKGKRS